MNNFEKYEEEELVFDGQEEIAEEEQESTERYQQKVLQPIIEELYQERKALYESIILDYIQDERGWCGRFTFDELFN